MGTSGRLIIVCGLPGGGKTDHAKRIAARLGAIRLSPDEWMQTLAIDLYDETARSRIEALQWRLGRELLQLSQTVIIEWGTWSRSERDALRRDARDLGATVELHHLDAPVDVLWERITRRGTESPPIARADLERWAAHFEAPTPEELALYDDPSRPA